MSDLHLVPMPRSVTTTGGDLVVDALSETISDELGEEAYRLVVDQEGVRLTAGSDRGLVLGRATWSQVLDAATTDAAGRTVVPAVHIEDEPTHSWRGLMVDCSRHFTPVPELRKLIDVLALHRMNRLHLHLTDDQGWRVEISGWPLLTEVGGYRARTLVGHHGTSEGADAEPVWTDEPHGGYYSQDDLRDLVAYAGARGVQLIPEIDLPGHMQAAIAAYPELGNIDAPIAVREVWGISDHVLAPTETAFQFVREVLTQVIDIFPAQWIHIGGDECPTVEWEGSAQAQEFMTERGLASERQIQREFLAVAHEVISRAGRTLIGWDEIVEAEPPADSVAMLWRPGADVPFAQRHRLSCVYANCATLYLDHYQENPKTEPVAIGGLTTLKDVYGTEELPGDATAAQRELLLGVQAQLWREYVPTDAHLEYMIFPRLCALSEVAWGTRTSYEDFVHRLGNGHLARLDRLGVRYRPLT
ncbi:beta-N-acetylhexosaminidase [Occultella kanbiaonis]|uniref:beta-N-acetylhexosaminidase n=1 Tax=Occultella kanbiaonis TaxID=2675754 RepID=UPI001F1A8224|nr:beta-N-acetylhexosaminidase [Occultella kanbiaonis]